MNTDLTTEKPVALLFHVGQKVRIKQHVPIDAQTPKFWIGAICEVMTGATSSFFKENYYMLAHPNGCVDTFREKELDQRFTKRPKCSIPAITV